MTSHKISLNGRVVGTIGDPEQYMVITRIGSVDRFDPDGHAIPESQLTSEAWDAAKRRVLATQDQIKLKSGDIIQIEIL